MVSFSPRSLVLLLSLSKCARRFVPLTRQQNSHSFVHHVWQLHRSCVIWDPFAAFFALARFRDFEFESAEAQRQRTCVSPVRRAFMSPLQLFPFTYVLLSDAFRYLERHPSITWVSYLGLASHSSHIRAQNYLRPNTYGGVLNFGVKADAKAAGRVEVG